MANEWQIPLEWKNEGSEPSSTLKNEGFKVGYKPPADLLNYFFHLVYICITELQDHGDNHNHTLDNLLDTLSISKGGTGGTTAKAAVDNLFIRTLINANNQVDANTLKDIGVYRCYFEDTSFDPTTLNLPSRYGVMLVFGASSYITQLFVDVSAMRMYHRSTSNTGSTWGAWRALATLTNGAVPVSNGGTGATDAATARENLGAVNKAGDTMTGQLNVPKVKAESFVQNPSSYASPVEVGKHIDMHLVGSTADYDGRISLDDKKRLIYNGEKIYHTGDKPTPNETGSWSLGAGTDIAAETDLDDLISIGNYQCISNDTAATLINCPIKSAFTMKVYYANGSAYYIGQEIIGHTSGATYRRTRNGSDYSWSDWKFCVPEATTTQEGLMSSTDKQKLDKIATGAEVNQNAFSKVAVGSTTIEADSKTDTLTFEAGDNVTITPDASGDKITISATDTTYSAASTSAAGLMSAADKKKLNGIAENANAYSLPAAGDGLGGVKTGGDVTITDGEITVNDDSHNHTLKNLTGILPITLGGTGGITAKAAADNLLIRDLIDSTNQKNANTLKDIGVYRVYFEDTSFDPTTLNLPSRYGVMLVYGASSYITQVFVDVSAFRMYHRSTSTAGSTWGIWKPVVTLNSSGAVDVSYGGTGATDAAKARENLGAVNKAGDTMTGALTVEDKVKSKQFVQDASNYAEPVEIGQYIDMHTEGSTADYDGRISVGTDKRLYYNGSRIYNAGDKPTPNDLGAWGLGAGTNIEANTNLNDLITVGNYHCSSNTIAAALTNSPTTLAFNMKVYYANGSAYYIAQEIIDMAGITYRRYRTGDTYTWNDWVKSYNSNTVVPIADGGTGGETAKAAVDNLFNRTLSSAENQVDANTMKDTGIYRCYFEDTTYETLNFPSKYGVMYVYGTSSYIAQLFVDVSAMRMYHRSTSNTGSTWGAWRALATLTNGAVPVSNGGTGATDAATARANLGVAPAYSYGTTDLTAGSSTLETGKLYFVYE